MGVEEANAPDTLAALESLRILRIGAGRWLPTLTIGSAALRAIDVLGLEPIRSPAPWLQRLAQTLLGRDEPYDWPVAVA